MKLIIAGGRNYRFTEADLRWLDQLHAEHRVTLVLSGKATGADAWGERWAVGRGITVEPHPARWDDLNAPGAVIRTNRWGLKYNVLAGFQRNQEMADRADALAVFPGGDGTADMLERATLRGLKIYESPSRPKKSA